MRKLDAKVIAGLILLALLTGTALAEPWLVHIWTGPHSPTTIGAFSVFAKPSWRHPLGTDRYGRDTLALVLLGLRNSLAVGAIAGVIGSAAGIVVGFISGYLGGWTDAALRTATDAWLVIPTFPLLAVLAAYVKVVTLAELSVILAIFSWPFAARAIRAQVLSLRERPYIDMARMSGERTLEVIFTEILPNMLPYLGVGFAASVIGAIVALVGLAIIGIGAANAITLGTLLNFGISWGVMSLGLWEIIVVPGLLLVVIFVSLNLINFGLEEMYNPRLQGVTTGR